ncbi:unnamed protein product [Kuraishia capsulata CBS 1993]|uniref:Uncharacterized protein n=1 Tax=Kuraishia capsulata CBS 1993 TaxID=1382522 RepID=W6MSS1_9ASCO|nr:uncharacterized protein KUCA_T00005860001 [Kuraishia capsulata CBS 1993]CDK29866.1 unnamed protein product [Kuraishia capsulata CBS 1993]
MLADDSVHKDEIEALQKQPPAYSLPTNTEYWNVVSRNKRRVKIWLEKYMSKDNDTFEQIWRTGGEVPDRTNSFYTHFPKKPTNLDSEHHYTSLINMNHFYLGRWLPEIIQEYLFPFEDLLKVPQKEHQSEIGLKLSSKAVPTREECSLCEKLNGTVIYDRCGVWSCVDNEAIKDQATFDITKQDSIGAKFFKSYREYASWKHNYTDSIARLEQQEMSSGNDAEAAQIETRLKQMEQLRKSNRVPSAIVVSKARKGK